MSVGSADGRTKSSRSTAARDARCLACSYGMRRSTSRMVISLVGLFGCTVFLVAPCFWLHRVFGCTVFLVAPCFWLHRVFGCTVFLVAPCFWLHRVFGCTVFLVAPCFW